MRKLCSWTVVYCTILAVGLLMATTVQARPNYLKWWIATYPDVAKKNNVAKAIQCNLCHVGTNKKNRNDYGKAIVKALDGATKAKKSVLEDALKTVEGEKSSTPDKTFGDLLKAEELPYSK